MVAEPLNNIGKKFYLGNGVELDLNIAFRCFTKSSSLGNDKAMYNLAKLYKKMGYDNIDNVLKFYKMSADHGNVRAMYEYANTIFEMNNNEYNLSEGFKYMQDAANANYADAQFVLGICYYKGVGVERNYEKSKKWLDLAILNGSKAIVNGVDAKTYKEKKFNNTDYYDDSNCALELEDFDE